jgi:hypothetical protein
LRERRRATSGGTGAAQFAPWARTRCGRGRTLASETVGSARASSRSLATARGAAAAPRDCRRAGAASRAGRRPVARHRARAPCRSIGAGRVLAGPGPDLTGSGPRIARCEFSSDEGHRAQAGANGRRAGRKIKV